MKRAAASCMIILLVVGALATIAGCGATKGSEGGKIEGINWALQTYKDGGTMSDVPADVSVDALFEGGMVGGSSGVNTYSATYELDGASLTIGPAVTTMMAGPEEAMAVEQAYLAALQEASSYTATQDALTIFDKDGGELLTYAKEEAPSLTGVTWKATGYNNGKEAVVTPIAGSEMTAVFSEKGRVSGSSGVNTYSGEYTLDGRNISIGPLASTLMAAADPALMEQEALYLAALQSAARYSTRGDRLELRREDGALAVSYVMGE